MVDTASRTDSTPAPKVERPSTAARASEATPANTPIDITVKARGAGGPVTLTVQAAGNLVDGANSIGISALKWTSTGTSFSATGTSNTTPVTVMTFNGSGNRTGTQNYTLDNSWDYVTGSYGTTLTYTLAVP